MKKQLCILIPLIAIVTLAIAFLGYLLLSGTVLDSGTVYVSEAGDYFIVYDNPVELYLMCDISIEKDLFDGLNSGDRILILRKSIVATSCPEECYVKACLRLRRGGVEDISPLTIDHLTEIGYRQSEKGTLPATDREIVARLNENSSLPFALLHQMTESELKKHDATAGFGCSVIALGEMVHVTYEDGCVSEEYESEFTLTPYPDYADGGWFVTSITTTSPYMRIGGVSASSGAEKIIAQYESMGFDVTVEGQTVMAKGGGVTVSFDLRGEKDVTVRVTVAVTNRDGIVY